MPVLGICYGEQAMVAQLGGGVEAATIASSAAPFVEIDKPSPLFDGVWKKGERHQVWMSHGDRVTQLPPGFEVVGVSEGAPFAAIADDERKLYAVQFHPEVAHTPRRRQLIGNFVRSIAGLAGRLDAWRAFRAHAIARDPRPGRQRAGDLRRCRAASTARSPRC